MEETMIGIIDLGSNTARMNVYEVKKEEFILQHSEKKTIGLAAYIDASGMLTKEGQDKAVSAIKKFVKTAKQMDVSPLYAIATASLRNAVNGQDVLAHINQSLGLSMDILTGEEEAIADLHGVRMNIPFTDGLVVDIGGGSTEIVLYRNNKVIYADALPMGSLSAYTQFVQRIIPTAKEIKQIQKTFTGYLRALDLKVPSRLMLYGLGGSIRATRKLYNHFFDYESLNVHMTKNQVQLLLDQVLAHNKDVQLDMVRLVPERVHTVIPGIAILQAICQEYSLDEMTVNHHGVREGYLYQKLYLDR
jgi:exopolyphosphatase / guanosine-5'-triphosphate,3'-diphosphate pyrophosphatase